MRFPELGYYTLPGRVSDPRPLFAEVAAGERAGLGSVWISERHDVKEAAARARDVGEGVSHVDPREVGGLGKVRVRI